MSESQSTLRRILGVYVLKNCATLQAFKMQLVEKTVMLVCSTIPKMYDLTR